MMSLKKGKFHLYNNSLAMMLPSSIDLLSLRKICGEEYDRKFNDPEI